jgi:hypothetical protein
MFQAIIELTLWALPLIPLASFVIAGVVGLFTREA